MTAIIEETQAVLDRLTPCLTLIRERARRYELEGGFPHEDFQDLREAGLFGLYVPETWGGLGFSDHPWPAWAVLKAIGGADLGVARAFEAHQNILEVIGIVGSPEQQERFFRAALKDGAIFGSWMSEPADLGEVFSESTAFGMTAKEVPGGYVVDGGKGFCSGAGGASFALLGVRREGSKDGSLPGTDSLTLVADVRQAGVTIDEEWWQPLGMVSSASHAVRFSNVFVPAENVLCEGSYYARFPWLLSKQLAQIGCSLLGAAEAGYKFALDYVKSRNLASDPFVQYHIAEMNIAVGSANRWAEYAAGLWADPAMRAEASDAGYKVRLMGEIAAQSVLTHVPLACGARSLFRQHSFERIYRDLSLYIRQMSSDTLRQGIAARALGLGHGPAVGRGGGQSRGLQAGSAV